MGVFLGSFKIFVIRYRFCTCNNSTLWGLRQEDSKFQPSLDNLVTYEYLMGVGAAGSVQNVQCPIQKMTF